MFYVLFITGIVTPIRDFSDSAKEEREGNEEKKVAIAVSTSAFCSFLLDTSKRVFLHTTVSLTQRRFSSGATALIVIRPTCSPDLCATFYVAADVDTTAASIAVLIAIRIILATCKSERKRSLFSARSLFLPFSTHGTVYQYIIPFSCRVLPPRERDNEPALKIFRDTERGISDTVNVFEPRYGELCISKMEVAMTEMEIASWLVCVERCALAARKISPVALLHSLRNDTFFLPSICRFSTRASART